MAPGNEQSKVEPKKLFSLEAHSHSILLNGRYERSDISVPVVEKATGECLFEVGVATAEDVARAAVDAARAQQEWLGKPGIVRGDILRRFSDLLNVHRPEIVEWIVRETGSVVGKGHFECDLTVREAIEYSVLPSLPQGHILPSTMPRSSYAVRAPLGVVGVITPWNSPLILGARAVLPALAAGNAVVLKPDVQTPVSGGFLIAELLREAGLPDGLLQVVPGGAETGEALVRDPNIQMISFTGSTEVGRKVGAIAGGLLKRVALELGGNNAFIVCEDADIERAAMAGAFGTFFHQGQICFSVGRHIVHESVVEEYTWSLVRRAKALRAGDPYRSDSPLGPIINARQADRVERILESSIEKGAKVVAGGKREGLFYEATVVENVCEGMALFDEEIFGPVAPIIPFRTDEEAISLANRTEYGLVAAVHSTDQARAMRIANRLRTGIVHINDQTVNHEVFGPIGGVGASGNGARSSVISALDEFTQWRWITVSEVSPDYPF